MKWYLPFSYGWESRAKTWLDKISFFVIWLLPLFGLCALTAGISIRFVLRFLLAATAQYSIYEIGYLQNDFITVRHEKFPNYRLAESQREEMKKRLKGIVAARLSTAAFCCLLLAATGVEESAMFRFVSALVILMGCFGLHNWIRSRWNILTYLLLCSVKYSVLLLLFCPVKMLKMPLLAIFFAFPFPRTLEHASKEKYGLCFLKGSLHRFRLIYYTVFSAVAMIGYLSGWLPLYVPLVALWYLSYRALAAGTLSWSEKIRTDRKRK